MLSENGTTWLTSVNIDVVNSQVIVTDAYGSGQGKFGSIYAVSTATNNITTLHHSSAGDIFAAKLDASGALYWTTRWTDCLVHRRDALSTDQCLATSATPGDTARTNIVDIALAFQ